VNFLVPDEREQARGIGNTIICFCDSLQAIPEFDGLGNEIARLPQDLSSVVDHEQYRFPIIDLSYFVLHLGWLPSPILNYLNAAIFTPLKCVGASKYCNAR